MQLKDVLKEISVSKFNEHPLQADARTLCLTGIEQTSSAVDQLVNVCYGLGLTAGWWHHVKDGTLNPNPNRNVPEMLCLIHSEISEGLEGYRRNLQDDKLPHRPMLEVELADALIRICDMAGGLGLDLAGAVQEKLQFNTNRADHKIENRMADDGKKI